MNVEQITMKPAEALARMGAYKKAAHLAQTAGQAREYAAVTRAYRALAKGKAVLDIADAFRRTGVDERFRPKLAILPATATRCYFQVGEHKFHALPRSRSWLTRDSRENSYELPGGLLPVPGAVPEKIRYTNLEAMVPLIPAPLMPKIALANFHILWEPVWAEFPPTDPYLLRHLSGTLFSIEAAWDLTPIERAAMGGR